MSDNQCNYNCSGYKSVYEIIHFAKYYGSSNQFL